MFFSMSFSLLSVKHNYNSLCCGEMKTEPENFGTD